MGYADTWGTQEAFARYEAIRHRMPAATFPAQTQECSGLVEIADHFDAFVLDSFGVLNVGETAIPGAVTCLKTLREMGKQLIVLTNAASYTRDAAIARYRKLGFDFAPEEVVSSRDVATARLNAILPNGVWGAIAAPNDHFEDITAEVVHWTGQNVDGFLLLSSAACNAEMVADIIADLKHHKRPLVIANPDLVAPREGGLSKEPGFYAHEVADALDLSPIFFGKPFPDAFGDVKKRLSGILPHRVAMVGDTLHTDILGGAANGFITVLVRDHGLFAGDDPQVYVQQSGIRPAFSCGQI